MLHDTRRIDDFPSVISTAGAPHCFSPSLAISFNFPWSVEIHDPSGIRGHVRDTYTINVYLCLYDNLLPVMNNNIYTLIKLDRVFFETFRNTK